MTDQAPETNNSQSTSASQPRIALPKPGAILELQVESVAFGGRGLARHQGAAVFIEGGLPGDHVRVRVTRRKPNYLESKVLEVLTESLQRTAPRCPHFGTCGGCKWQNYLLEAQLQAKASQVEDALRHGARYTGPITVHPPIPSPQPWHYRNKMEFAFGRRRDDPWSGPQSIQVGLHQPGDFRHVLPIDECYLTPPSMESARLAARDSLRQLALQHPNSITIHDLKTHRGLLRHLVLRSSQASGAWLAAFITTSDPFPEVEQFAEALMKSAPHCAGLLWGISDGLSDVARPESIQKVWGNPILTERLGSLEFRLSPFSFFQTNTLGAEQLYDVVARFANLQGHERVLDAYCGTGTIGLYLAKAAKEIVGIELIEEAVEDARHNASMNGITNTQFWAGDMKEVLANHYAVTESPDFQPPFDLIVMDPPRGGMDKKALRRLLDLRPPRFIYVSCNPSTLARDAQDLLEKGYRPTQIQTVDLFPHTYHIESVVEFIHQS